MATRATYSFNQLNSKKKTFVYIHWDGYPEGAATYFYNTIIRPSKGCFATQFIRANDNAELTLDHNSHSDTSFNYDIVGNDLNAEITAYSIKYGVDFLESSRYKQCIFSGKLHEFITKNNNLIENFEEFKEYKRYGKSCMMNLTIAKRYLKQPIIHLNAWKNNHEGIGNWNYCVEQARSIIDVFPELYTQEIADLFSRK